MAIKLIILLILAHQFHAVASVILKGTPISTHPYGSKVKLTCVKEDGALVWTTSTGDILFNEEARYSKDEKYDNFKVDISGNQSSMIITNALFEDEGEYSCSDTISKATIQVNIEVAPRLRISYGGRQDPGPHLPSLSSPSISITCLAEGAKPEVSIRFKVGESDWLSPTNNEITPRGVLFDTNATLNFQFIDDPNGNVVTCETSGQSSINPIAETQTLITPNCNLETNKIEATCNCTSNPPVYKYILSINGKMEVGNTINVENLGDSNISCFGVNYIGVGISSSIVLESTTDSSFPFYVIIIVVVILGAVAVITLVMVYRRRKKHKSEPSLENSKSGDSENKELTEENHQENPNQSETDHLVKKNNDQDDHEDTAGVRKSPSTNKIKTTKNTVEPSNQQVRRVEPQKSQHLAICLTKSPSQDTSSDLSNVVPTASDNRTTKEDQQAKYRVQQEIVKKEQQAKVTIQQEIVKKEQQAKDTIQQEIVKIKEMPADLDVVPRGDKGVQFMRAKFE